MYSKSPVFILDPIRSVRPKPVNIVESDDHLFQHEYTRTIGSSVISIVHNTVILNDQIISSDSKNTISSSNYLKSHLRSLSSTILSKTRSPINIKLAVWIAEAWTHDYFHWVTEGLTKLLLLRYSGITADVLLPSKYKNFAYITESLNYFNLPFKQVPSNQLVKVDFLYRLHYNYDAGNYDYRILNILKEYLAQKGLQAREESRIWVSRSFARKRKLLNESNIAPVLSKYKFRIVHLETLTFAEQVKLFESSKFVAGMHGGGLTNILFMPKDGKILEIRHKSDSHSNCYFSLASNLNHKYYYLLADSQGKDPHNDDCSLDPASLDLQLSKICL